MNPFWIKQRRFFFLSLFIFWPFFKGILCNALPTLGYKICPAFRGVNAEDGLKSKINFQLFALHAKTAFQVPFFC